MQVVTLDLQRNELEGIPGCVFELPCIEELNVSRNRLVAVPSIPLYSLHLTQLNLSHNQLSSLPAKMIMPKIASLNISHNQFRDVPKCISSNVTLEILNISENPDILSLPPELGRIKNLHRLHLSGLKDLSDPPKSIQKDTIDIMNYLRSKLKGAKEFYRMKLMLVGYARRGKTTLVAHLQGKECGDMSTVGVDISEWTLKTGFKKPFHFSIWDFGGQEEYYATHQCFLSKNSLYLLIFNLKHGEEGVKELKPWLNNIALRAPGSRVVIVGTHLDEIDDRQCVGELGVKVQELAESFCVGNKLYISEMIPVGLKNYLENISTLKETIYHQTAEYKTKNGEPIMGKKIPASYHTLDKKLQSMQLEIRQGKMKPVMHQEEFKTMVQQMGLSDIQTLEELKTAVAVLNEVGSILHFDDRGHDLHELYFLDPRWLCDMMSKVVTIKERNPFVRNGVLHCKDIPMLFKEQQFPLEIFEQYLALLGRFEIALPLDNKRVLIPSMLPEEIPELACDKFQGPMSSRQTEYTRYIVFKADRTPPGFWSRVLSRIMHFVPQICNTLDKIASKDEVQSRPNSLNHSSTEMSASVHTVQSLSSSSESEQDELSSHFTCSKEESSQSTRLVTVGLKRFNSKRRLRAAQQTNHPISFADCLPNFPSALQINTAFSGSLRKSTTNVKLEYWRTGLYYCDPTLMFCIQSLQNFDGETREGVFIKASATDSGKEIVSQLVDLVTTLMKEWYPGLKKYHQETLCCECICHGQEKPYIFTDKDCLDMLTEGRSTIECCYSDTQKHNVAIVDIFPDMLVDPKFLLDLNEINMTSTSKLGSGSYGTVFKGTYHGRQVAIKKYQLEEGRKVPLAAQFNDLRLEARLLQKLHHPCLVCMVGICIHPDLMALVLELAPRRSLDSAIIGKEEGPIHRITIYRIAAQVAAGLRFLHRQGIVFRDLKAANVLLWSLQHDSLSHCKLTDFGVATHFSPIGTKGTQGTPGFIAPEVLHNSPYNHRADIFSFGMLLYEVISHKHPFDGIERQKIGTMVQSGGRPKLNDVVRAHTGYYYLTQLMKKCWEENPKHRPSTDEIITKVCSSAMQSVMCVQPLSSTYSIRRSAVVSFDGDRPSELWVCSVGKEGTQLSVYNTHNMLKINQNFISDNQVQCIAKCGEYIWVGSRVGIGEACLDIFTADTHELVHNIGTRENSVFCISSYKNSVYLGTVEGICISFPNNIESIRNTARPKFKYVSDHSIDGIVCTDQYVWLSSTKFIHFLDHESLTCKTSIQRVKTMDDFVGQLSLSPEKNIIWSAHLGGSLLTAWNAQQRVHMYDVNTSLYLKKITDISSQTDAIITAMTPVLDSVWVGMASGHILVFHQDELLMWYKPYTDYVRFLVCVPGCGPCGKEKCVVVSGGKNFQPLVEGLNEDSKELQSINGEENHTSVIVMWEAYDSRTMMQIKIVEVNAPNFLDNHKTLCNTIIDGEFSDGTQILPPSGESATGVSPSTGFHDTNYKQTRCEGGLKHFADDRETDHQGMTLYLEHELHKQEHEMGHLSAHSSIPKNQLHSTHTQEMMDRKKAPHVNIKRTHYKTTSSVLAAFDISLPNSLQKYRITCQKPAKLDVLLNRLQMDATLSAEEAQIEYFVGENDRIKIATQEQFEKYLTLTKRPQLWLSETPGRSQGTQDTVL